jgi:hypothetical protein
VKEKKALCKEGLFCTATHFRFNHCTHATTHDSLCPANWAHSADLPGRIFTLCSPNETRAPQESSIAAFQILINIDSNGGSQ